MKFFSKVLCLLLLSTETAHPVAANNLEATELAGRASSPFSFFQFLQKKYPNAFPSSSSRMLQDTIDLPCNVPYFSMSSMEIAALLTEWFTVIQFFGYPEGAEVLASQVPLITHDVLFQQVCASCESEGLSGYGCDISDYGADTTHSGLLLLPIDKEMNLIKTNNLQAFITTPSVTVVYSDNYIQANNIGLNNLEYSLLAASIGLVSITPYKTGYGESEGLVISGLVKKSVTTATLPLFSKSKTIVGMMSNEDTVLVNESYYLGYSEGGYFAVAAASGMSQHGIVPIKVLSGAAPIKTSTQLPLGYFNNYRLGLMTNPINNLNVAIVGLAFSNTRPGVSNYNTTQTYLKPEMIDTLMDFFTDQNCPPLYSGQDNATDIFFEYAYSTYPSIFLTDLYFSDNVTNFVYNAIDMEDDDPCVNNPTLASSMQLDKLCEALIHNDLTKDVLDATYEIEFCHSYEDVLIIIDNVPDLSLLKHNVTGSHSEASLRCGMNLFAGISFESPEIEEEEEEEEEDIDDTTDIPTPSPKSTKTPKITKSPKTSKQPKGPKKTKEPKGPKKTKEPKEPKEPKASKTPKTPKQ